MIAGWSLFTGSVQEPGMTLSNRAHSQEVSEVRVETDEVPMRTAGQCCQGMSLWTDWWLSFQGKKERLQDKGKTCPVFWSWVAGKKLVWAAPHPRCLDFAVLDLELGRRGEGRKGIPEHSQCPHPGLVALSFRGKWGFCAWPHTRRPLHDPAVPPLPVNVSNHGSF